MSSVSSRTNSHDSAFTIDRQWDPMQVLGLCRDGLCVGYALTRKRKCRNVISMSNRRCFDETLAQLSSQPLNVTLLRPKLALLAHHGLCVRWHSDQVDDMVHKWIKKIQDTLHQPTELRTPSRGSATSTRSTVASYRPSSPETIRYSPETIHYSSSSSIASSVPEPHNGVASHSDTDDESALTNSPPLPRPATHFNLPQSIARSEDPVLPAAARTTAPNNVQGCNSTHARRKTLTDDCPICYIGPLSSHPASELVWCTSTCGRSVHRSCFDDWQAQRLADGQALYCPVCRADWDKSCACGGRSSCSTVHKQRHATTESCPICKDDMSDEEELEWCKDGCGHNVHKQCQDAWANQCAESDRGANCTMCRTEWSVECGCS